MPLDLVMVGSCHYHVVALSILVSMLAAYAARDLSERVRDARDRAWFAWLVGGSMVDGIGTWSMHFTGMLAFRLPVTVEYDWPTVVLSLVVGMIGSAEALLIVSHRTIGWPRALAASIFMGGPGISGLHYNVMAAMWLPARHHYAPALVTLSVVLAIVLSLMALSLTFLLRDDALSRIVRNHGSAVLRGAANPVMHYTVMAAVSFTRSSELPYLSHAVSISSLGVLGISIVPVMVLVVALLISLVDRLQKQRALLDQLFEQAPQAVAFMDADNRVVCVNREFTWLFGYTPAVWLHAVRDYRPPPPRADRPRQVTSRGAAISRLGGPGAARGCGGRAPAQGWQSVARVNRPCARLGAWRTDCGLWRLPGHYRTQAG